METIRLSNWCNKTKEEINNFVSVLKEKYVPSEKPTHKNKEKTNCIVITFEIKLSESQKQRIKKMIDKLEQIPFMCSKLKYLREKNKGYEIIITIWDAGSVDFNFVFPITKEQYLSVLDNYNKICKTYKEERNEWSVKWKKNKGTGEWKKIWDMRPKEPKKFCFYIYDVLHKNFDGNFNWCDRSNFCGHPECYYSVSDDLKKYNRGSLSFKFYGVKKFFLLCPNLVLAN